MNTNQSTESPAVSTTAANNRTVNAWLIVKIASLLGGFALLVLLGNLVFFRFQQETIQQNRTTINDNCFKSSAKTSPT